MSDEELVAAYKRELEDAHTAPKAGHGGYEQEAVFASVRKALELRQEMKRRKLI